MWVYQVTGVHDSDGRDDSVQNIQVSNMQCCAWMARGDARNLYAALWVVAGSRPCVSLKGVVLFP